MFLHHYCKQLGSEDSGICHHCCSFMWFASDANGNCPRSQPTKEFQWRWRKRQEWTFSHRLPFKALVSPCVRSTWSSKRCWVIALEETSADTCYRGDSQTEYVKEFFIQCKAMSNVDIGHSTYCWTWLINARQVSKEMSSISFNLLSNAVNLLKMMNLVSTHRFFKNKCRTVLKHVFLTGLRFGQKG